MSHIKYAILYITMKVKINGGTENYRTVWLDGLKVRLINQLKLPYKFEIFECRDYQETASAIRDMVVRGAPAIGATAAYGLAQAVNSFDGKFDELGPFVESAKSTLATRPTAHDLFDGLDYVGRAVMAAGGLDDAKTQSIAASCRYADESAQRCRKIGEIGQKLIKDGARVLTHCNAGALGCVDYGTALAPIRFASGRGIFVWVDETRPRLQGARLTAWELAQEGINHSIIADNAAGYFMQNGEVDIVIVGADRIAKNADVVNKIGTYEKAILAKENGIPFYVAAPTTTIDKTCACGKDAIIEERTTDEVLFAEGPDKRGVIQKIRIANPASSAKNPAFDVTPAKYVAGIITEGGII